MDQQIKIAQLITRITPPLTSNWGTVNKKPRLSGRGFKVKQPKEKVPTLRFAKGAGRLTCASPAV